MVEVWQGTPRDVLKHMNDAGFQPPRTDCQVHFKVNRLGEDPKKLQWLMGLIPDNTLLGCSDNLPGLSGSRLPPKAELVL